MRLICFVCSRRPRPKSSTPALLDTAVRPEAPCFTRALIKFSGIPQSPKPPTSSVLPLGMSFTASSAEATIFDEDDADAKEKRGDALAVRRKRDEVTRETCMIAMGDGTVTNEVFPN